MTKVFHNDEHIELAIERELVQINQLNEEVRHLRQLSEDLDLSDGLHTVVFVLVDVLYKLNSHSISSGIAGRTNHLAVATLAYHLSWSVVFRDLSPLRTEVQGSCLFLF